MVDTQFLRLSETWAIAYDKNQWIVQHYMRPKWRSIAFVGCNKGVLMRVLREKGAKVAPEARAALDALPDTFREWVSVPLGRRFKAASSAISGVVVGRTAPAPERSRDRAKTAA